MDNKDKNIKNISDILSDMLGMNIQAYAIDLTKKEKESENFGFKDMVKETCDMYKNIEGSDMSIKDKVYNIALAFMNASMVTTKNIESLDKSQIREYCDTLDDLYKIFGDIALNIKEFVKKISKQVIEGDNLENLSKEELIKIIKDIKK